MNLRLFSQIESIAILSIGCSTEAPLDNYNNIEELYSELSEVQISSIFSENSSNRNKGRSLTNASIPGFSPEDLKYLSSLSQVEFEAVRNNLISQLGVDEMYQINEIQDNNYMRILNLLESQDGMMEYINFSVSYLQSSGGMNNLLTLIPNGLNEEAIKLYVAMAVYIDKLGRPLMIELINSNSHISRAYHAPCELNAAIELSIAGIDMGVDVLCDIMTGGAATGLTPLEETALGADLMSIWLNYEVCCGRWHLLITH